ncbi:MAG: LicD family protein [Pseudomonadota bacterium]|nr:LicD family protein [Pseudomonadota bacterium]
MFKVRQQWQFELERTLHEAGRPRVDDPVFACRALPAPASRAPDAARRVAPGSYRARWSFRGLRITGFLDPRYTKGLKIRLLLNGKPLREVSVAKAPLIPPYFQITIQRPALATFPPTSELALESTDGKTLLCEGCSVTHLDVPHGTGSAVRGLSAIDKKGFLVMANADLAKRQAEFLEIYRAAREAFAREFGKPLFLLYGTLLGFHRSGDFIPGDDDFDVGYASACTTAREVKLEAMQIVVCLVTAGFVVSFNRNGRLFRLRLPGMPPSSHLDVHSVWFERDATWIHPQARLACREGDFLPTREGIFRGIAADVPCIPEAFLGAYYGDGWRIPDPSYSTAAKHIPKGVLRNLARAFVTPVDLANMQREIERRTGSEATHGRLISIGSYSLYPVGDYEQNCDW